MRPTAIRLSLHGIVAVVFLFMPPVLRAAEQRGWERFPMPPGRANMVSSVGLDEDNGLWIMSGQGCYYWNAADRAWVGPVLAAGYYLAQLHGTPATGLYATQSSKTDHQGTVFRLGKGEARYVTDFHYDTATAPAPFRVSRNGRLVNWSGGKMRVYAAGQWSEADARLPQSYPIFFDRGQTISLYSRGQLYVVDDVNKASQVTAEVQFDRGVTNGALWGNDNAIVLESGSSGVRAFDVRSGKAVDVSSVNSVLAKRVVYDLFRTWDGAVWIMAADGHLRNTAFYRVAPDGTTREIAATTEITWQNWPSVRSSENVLMDKAGVLWFANPRIGVFTLNDGKLKRFDPREDHGPAFPTLIASDANGAIYTAGGDWLYAYNNGESLTGRTQPRYPPVTTFSQMVWKYDLDKGNRLSGAWYLDGRLLIASERGNGILALEPKSGRTCFSVPLQARNRDSYWVSRGNRDGQLTVCADDSILTVESASGKPLQTATCKRDWRIAPVPVGSDHVLPPGYEESSFSRVDAKGKTIWTRSLPGFLIAHPTAYGSLLVAQTRQGSYGGQATVGIDMETGEQLWTDEVDAYGCGVAFADDARYCVEGDMWLSPGATEARLICRTPRNGKVLWTYRKAGTTLSHAPLLDRATDRIYAVLDDGTVVCVDGQKGTSYWETTLPQEPLKAPNGSHESHFSCLSLGTGLLAVTDCTWTLYLIRPQDGEVLDRVALTDDVPRMTYVAPNAEPAGPPWIIGDLLVVPWRNGVRAYALDVSKYRQQGGVPRPGSSR